MLQPIRHTLGLAARQLIGSIVSVDTKDPVVALTFDDGPDPVFTPRLLNVLEHHHAKATFFMVGDNVRQYPATVQQVADGGHAIGNHSWNHPSFPLITAAERRIQLRRCASALTPYGGLRLFRPPYGQQSFASHLDARWLGYSVVMFNLEVGDWHVKDVRWMADRMVQEIRPGSIVCLHDQIYPLGNASDRTVFDRAAMLDALGITLERLHGRMRFVTVPELLKYGRPNLSLRNVLPPQELLPRLQDHPLLKRKKDLGSAGIP